MQINNKKIDNERFIDNEEFIEYQNLINVRHRKIANLITILIFNVVIINLIIFIPLFDRL